MSRMPEATTDPQAARTRAFAAAARLLREPRETPVSAEQACHQAGLPDDVAAQLWPDPRSFEFDLLAHLLYEVRDSVAKTTLGMPAGLSRLMLAIETYLEANLARPAVRRLALRLQAHPDGAMILRSRIAGFTLMMEMELAALKWPHAAATSRLFTAALLELAQAEHEAGRALAELRMHVYRHFDGGRT